MEHGIYVQAGADVGKAVVTAESIDMLLRTAAETRTSESVIMHALNVLARSVEAAPVSISNCSFEGPIDKSFNPANLA